MALLIYLVLAHVAASATPGSRIVGGTPTSIEEFPYIVALVYTYPGTGITVQRCVGSLLSSCHVVTSAFCFTGADNENMKVRAGSTTSLSGGTVVELADVVKHPDYAEKPRTADIAVVSTKTPLPLSEVINILYLPPAGTFFPDGHEVKVVSWGFEYEGGPQLELLKTTLLNKVGFEECVVAYAGSERVQISDDVICAKGDGRGILCIGDSGAPMIIGEELVGIYSFLEECGSAIPDVFIKIDIFAPWILEVATGSNIDDDYIDAVGVKNVPVRL